MKNSYIYFPKMDFAHDMASVMRDAHSTITQVKFNKEKLLRRYATEGGPRGCAMFASRCLARGVERLDSRFVSAVKMLKADKTSEAGNATCALAEQRGQCALWILLWDGAAGCWPVNLSSDISLLSLLVQNAAKIDGLVAACAKTMFGNNALHSSAHIASHAVNLLLNDIFLCICIFYQLSNQNELDM